MREKNDMSDVEDREYPKKIKNVWSVSFEEPDQDYLTVDVTTLEAINTKLQDRLPEMPTVNVRTIAKHLDDTLYTLKLSRQLPAERNTRSHPTLPSIFPVVPRRGQSYPHDLHCIVWV